MSSYHTSFTYLNKNSADEGFLVVAFEPDNGFTDAFLGMDQVYEDYYDGTKKFLYGTKYNTTATITITLIKSDGSDFTIADNRRALKWLTGSRTASWLDLYDGEKFRYSFLGTVTTSQQYKIDGRVVGVSVEFTSLSPWAYSAEQIFDRSIAQALVFDNSILSKDPANEISLSEDGVLCNSAIPGPGACFCVDEDGVLYVENIIVASIDNETDDSYTYIYLDIEYENESCEWLEIKRELDNGEYEITRMDNLQNGDVIYITGKQFIVAYTRDQITGELVNQERIFGDDFNFIWPRLVPGVNNFIIEGNGDGTVKFAYRYPMKVGDCAMDISTYGSGIDCCAGAEMPTYDTVRWEDITGTPTSIGGYGITDAYTKDEVDDKIDDIEISGGSGSGFVSIKEEELNNMLEDILG